VIPLIPRPEDAESVTVLGGNGGRCATRWVCL
jgi:hypothetical protein